MKMLTDWALIRMYDAAHAARRRTDDVETTESLTGELIANRAHFDTFGRLTTYCQEHDLVLLCEFGVGPGANVVPDWTVRLGTVTRYPEGRGAEEFAEATSASGPVLGDVLRQLAVNLGLMSNTALTSGIH